MTTEKMVKAIVARGRSLYFGEGRRVLGFDKDTNQEIFGPATWRYVLPGETVELPASEVERMRALGYLVDPSKVAPPEEGPRIVRSEDRDRPGLVEQRMR